MITRDCLTLHNHFTQSEQAVHLCTHLHLCVSYTAFGIQDCIAKCIWSSGSSGILFYLSPNDVIKYNVHIFHGI